MGLLWTIVIILLCLGALTGVGFLIDHILSGESSDTCKACSGRTPHCQSGTCVQCTESKHCSGATPRCNNGVCVAALGCSQDSECKAGEECENGKCIPIPCTATSGCEDPLVCKDGKCTLECLQSSQCKENEECKANRCVPKSCSATSECTPPLQCKDGTCQLECLIDEQCESGKVCDGGVCTVDLTCSKKADCAVGEVCHQGSCSRPCFDSRVCPAGTECFDGYCVRTKLPCPSSASNVKGVCVKKLCTSSADCAGMKCDDGQCKPLCQSDADCPAGARNRCREGKCVVNTLPHTYRPKDPHCLWNQWDGSRPNNTVSCAWIYEANSNRVPSATDAALKPFLMYEGDDDWTPCLQKCIFHPECKMAYFNDKSNPKICHMYSKGVNETRKSGVGTTASKVYHAY
jgi:hypothetical protein